MSRTPPFDHAAAAVLAAEGWDVPDIHVRRVNQWLAGVPARWHRPLRDRYRRLRAAAGDRAANVSVRRASECAAGVSPSLTEDDAAVVLAAERAARRMRRALGPTTPERVRAVRLSMDIMGPPRPEHAADQRRVWSARAAVIATVGDPCTDAADLGGELARYIDPLWWRRRLRAWHGRQAEAGAVAAGLVCKTLGAYCSDTALHRVRTQRRRNRDLLESLEATNDRGQSYTLADLADRTTANPALRRAELMTRVRGLEAGAAAYEAALFVTWTAPSRMHATRPDGAPNPAYDGTTPRQAQRHLARQWARARAWLAKLHIDCYGLRVAEPHHDGTPHWHLLIWCHRTQRRRLLDVLRGYALGEGADRVEPGAARHRLRVEHIDARRGGAAAYVAKYVAKSVDGLRHDGTTAGDDRVTGASLATAAARVTAWAATWGIRQFQFFGTARVGVWRELRRLREATDCLPLEPARLAADGGHWDLYTRAQYRNPIKLWHAPRGDVTDPQTGEILPAWNRYGEPAGPRLRGLAVAVDGARVHVETRTTVWTVARRDAVPGAVLALGQLAPCEVLSPPPPLCADGWGALLEAAEFGRFSDPWTRVNNCNHPGESADENADHPALSAWRGDPIAEWAAWAAHASG